jgi:LacI family transcriptional regulator
VPNQREIAAAAGVTQAAVSRALRGDRSIPLATRQRIEAIAERLGYRPNAYVSSLMAYVRSGRPLQEKGCIALLVDAASEKDWLGHIGGYAYALQYRGVAQRAGQLGFTTECFFLRPQAENSARIDRILRSRGITGLVLMPSRNRSEKRPVDLALSWENYAVATIAYSWAGIAVDSVAAHHRHNVDTAFARLAEKGYRRIGMCLPPEAYEGVDYSWRERHLLWQQRLSPRQRVPLFVGKPGLTPLAKFKAWLQRWKPDAVIGLVGHEKEWLDQLGLSQPAEIGLACLNRPPDSPLAGVEENLDTVGAAAMDAVANRILHNEYGLPEHPRLVLIEGSWKDGETLAPTPRG